MYWRTGSGEGLGSVIALQYLEVGQDDGDFRAGHGQDGEDEEEEACGRLFVASYMQWMMMR